MQMHVTLGLMTAKQWGLLLCRLSAPHAWAGMQPPCCEAVL